MAVGALAGVVLKYIAIDAVTGILVGDLVINGQHVPKLQAAVGRNGHSTALSVKAGGGKQSRGNGGRYGSGRDGRIVADIEALSNKINVGLGDSIT